MVESVKGMPASLAALAARISPSPCCMPRSPIGDSANGADTFCPTMVVARLRSRHVHQHALAQPDLFQIGAVGAQRLLVIGAAFGVIVKGARNLAAGELPQVLDAGDGRHGG